MLSLRPVPSDDLATLTDLLARERAARDAADDRGDGDAAAGHSRAMAVLKRTIEMVRHREDSGLPSDENHRSVSVAMNQAHLLRRDRPGQPLKSRHPFPRALDKKGIAVEAWARDHGINAVTVRAWYGKGEAGRRIPRAIAEIIEHELGVPATLDVWKNGIR